MVLSQVVNGVVLPFVLIFMLLLTNDRELMGEHVNSRGFNIVAWVTVVVMIGADDRDARDAAVGSLRALWSLGIWVVWAHCCHVQLI